MTQTSIELEDRRSQLEDSLWKHQYKPEEIEQMIPKLEEIERLKKQKNAALLAHYYQIPAIQLVADVRGDSLKLAYAAREIKNPLVVCSTVHFMAEMVKLLSPDKKVLIPDMDASCSIAEGITGEAIRQIRKQFPSAAVVGYINTAAEAKAEMDAVCTSANAQKVVENIQGDPVILLPDYFFAKNVFAEIPKERRNREYLAYKKKTGHELVLENTFSRQETLVKTGTMHLPMLDKGTCIVHEQFLPGQIAHYKKMHNLEIAMAHPEVNPIVAAEADMVGGTQKMIEYVRKSPAKRFLIITECDLTAPLREAYPDREFITPCIICPYMKKNSLAKIINSLQNEVHEVTIPDKIATRALRSLERMFELSEKKG